MAEPDLHTRLRSAIEERLALAQAAAENCGCCESTPEWSFGDDENDGRIVVKGDRHPGVRKQLSRRWNRSYGDLHAARHIAANDPYWVIRACRADLDRLQRHAAKGWSAEQVAKTPAVADERWCESCNYTAQPCPEVRSLAEVWLEAE